MDPDDDAARRVEYYSSKLHLAVDIMRTLLDSSREIPDVFEMQLASIQDDSQAVLASIETLTSRLEQKTVSEADLRKLRNELSAKSEELSSLERRKDAEINSLKAQITSSRDGVNKAPEGLHRITEELQASRLNARNAEEPQSTLAQLPRQTRGPQNSAVHRFGEADMDNFDFVPVSLVGRDEYARLTDRQTDLPRVRYQSIQESLSNDNSHARVSFARSAERSKRTADDVSESDEGPMPLATSKRRRPASLTQTPLAADQGTPTLDPAVGPPGGITRAKLTESERRERAVSVLSLVHLDWDTTEDEETKLTEQLMSSFTRGRAVDEVKQAIDKHVVGNFRKTPPSPRSCLFATLSGEAAGPGGSMTRRDCPYCRTRTTVCVWAEYPDGVASAYGPRNPDTRVVSDTRWRPNPVPYTVAVEGRQVRWLFKKRAEH